MQKAIMMRVGIDSKYGAWNAPCNPANGDFVYVPVPSGKRVPESRDEDSLLAGYYGNDIAADIERFSARNDNQKCLHDYREHLRRGLADKSAHLDPDFRSGYLSYGNSNDGDIRAEAIKGLRPGDIVIFYNSMQPINKPKKSGNLEYGIIGRLKVQAVKRVKAITDGAEIRRSIHTRRQPPVDTDVVAIGAPEESGRFEKYLPIGICKRLEGNKKRSYYLSASLAEEWGEDCNTFIVRAKSFVTLKNSCRVLNWLEHQNPSMIHKNNP